MYTSWFELLGKMEREATWIAPLPKAGMSAPPEVLTGPGELRQLLLAGSVGASRPVVPSVAMYPNRNVPRRVGELAVSSVAMF